MIRKNGIIWQASGTYDKAHTGGMIAEIHQIQRAGLSVRLLFCINHALVRVKAVNGVMEAFKEEFEYNVARGFSKYMVDGNTGFIFTNGGEG